MPRSSNEVIDAGPGAVPAWADELVDVEQPREWEKRAQGVDLRGRCGERFALVEAVVAGAAELGDDDFSAAVEAAYTRIGEELGGLTARYPVRFWNYVPRIHRQSADGLDRYMVFNAARQAAYRRWHGDGPLGENLPTASALDSGGPELIVHALASSHRGRSFENPRQVPAYRYSSRYGPQPPCFARATAVPMGDGGPHRLMIGGTASIVGEESRHPKDLRAQLEETANNLSSLLAAVADEERSDRAVRDDESEPGRGLSELRAYVVRRDDRDAVVAELARRFPGVQRFEVMPARLCRRSLLVEVEGLAHCDVELPESQIPVERAVRPAQSPQAQNRAAQDPTELGSPLGTSSERDHEPNTPDRGQV